MSVFQVIGLGMNLMGGMAAAKAQEQQSKDTAENMITDRIIGEAQAVQQQVMRYTQYFDDLAANEATLLYNRDFTTTIDAIFEEQKEIAFDDLATMQTQAGLESGKKTVASLVEIQRGKNQAAATRIRTMSNFMSGMHDWASTGYSMTA